MVEIQEYDSYNVIRNKYRKIIYSGCSSSFYAEDMFADIQDRGTKFHKIKKLSPKYKKIQTHWNIKYNNWM